jgi:hypothetical protein
MNVALHLRTAGWLLIVLGAANFAMPRYFGWTRELAAVSIFTRQVFSVHCFFIALTVAMMGACSALLAPALLAPGPLSRAILGGMLLFWLCRLVVQWFVYDPAIWRGRTFYACMHALFSLLWAYLCVTYAAALRSVW